MPLPTTRPELEARGYRFNDEPAKCRKCKRAILWATTPQNHLMPIDVGTYVSHFATCPYAVLFRHRKGGGQQPKGQ